MDGAVATVTTTVRELQSDHSRLFRLGKRPFVSVYPVLSRRAGGISVGVNLNLDRGCNFDCIYCQVDRTGPPSTPQIALRELPGLVEEELSLLFDSVSEGAFFSTPPFDALPAHLRGVRDIAFSGDGEPTLSPVFSEVSEGVRGFLSKRFPEGSPPLLRLITNGTGLFGEELRRRTERTFLLAGPGEIWLKVDAATDPFYSRIDRSRIPLARMMEGLSEIVMDLPVTLQTMVLDFGAPGAPGAFVSDRSFWDPLLAQVAAWCEKGAKIREWHLYGVARPPALSDVRVVESSRLLEWAKEAGDRLSLPVKVFS